MANTMNAISKEKDAHVPWVAPAGELLCHFFPWPLNLAATFFCSPTHDHKIDAKSTSQWVVRSKEHTHHKKRTPFMNCESSFTIDQLYRTYAS